jgi:hypothetical protein
MYRHKNGQRDYRERVHNKEKKKRKKYHIQCCKTPQFSIGQISTYTKDQTSYPRIHTAHTVCLYIENPYMLYKYRTTYAFSSSSYSFPRPYTNSANPFHLPDQLRQPVCISKLLLPNTWHTHFCISVVVPQQTVQSTKHKAQTQTISYYIQLYSLSTLHYHFK